MKISVIMGFVHILSQGTFNVLICPLILIIIEVAKAQKVNFQVWVKKKSHSYVTFQKPITCPFVWGWYALATACFICSASKDLVIQLWTVGSSNPLGVEVCHWQYVFVTARSLAQGANKVHADDSPRFGNLKEILRITFFIYPGLALKYLFGMLIWLQLFIKD